MRKFLAILLALTLCLGSFAMAEEAADTTTDASSANTLVVGTPAMNGDFIEGFGSSAYDNSIKTLTNGFCYTIADTPAGEYITNPTVIENLDITTDEAGNKIYTFKLYDDLKWSDGSSITATDYVSGVLWDASPKWLEVGGSSRIGLGLLGYKAYQAGETDVFAGVKLIDDLTFSLTIDAAELPYFYENIYARIRPIPAAVYAPGAEIVSDENGSSFGDYDILSAMQTVSQTERFAPTICCGPYKFISYENNAVTMEINEYFKGDLDGDKPTIQYVVQKFVNQDTDIDAVISGDLDLVTGEIEGKKIEAAKAADTAELHDYLRAGYGLLAMSCDWGVTADPNVRWALAYLIDRSAVVDYVLEGYGGTVNSQYGYAQWMYEEAGEELEEELTPFNLNVQAANECLDKTEWKYESDGVTPFDASKANADGTYMRYNDKGEMLTVNHLGTEDNSVTDIIEIQYVANAPLAGMNFVVTRSDFSALLDNYQHAYEKGDDRKYNTFNLASNFDPAFDPYTMSWHSDYCGTWTNSCQLSDSELDELIMELRSTEPGDNDTFIDVWLKYEKRWQELMPQIPLYSNQYFDIYNTRVSGVETTPFANYEDVICKITKSAN
ncbi:MAG: ABC transporter substrate-binding protein [Clostridia bacterium]|nr:ABC transporter substrate-binding protein [Clostridia bacterium]